MRKSLKKNCLILMTLIFAPAFAADPATRGAEVHRAFLEWEAGAWDAVITLPDPAGGEPTRFAGEQVDRMGACGGWLITDLTMVASPGEPAPPYAGHGVLGFDPAKDRLVGLWIDSNTDWLAKAEGSVDASGRVLTLEVEGRHPATGEPMPRTFVTTRIDDDTRRLEVFIPAPGGGTLRVATIDYTRRTAAD